jgi:alanine-glyoxylate transaminase/serine-glyoxylate transaminase/serine-pyruvate transaminase
MLPAGVDGAKVIAHAFRRYNLALGAGLSKVAGRLFRIGHVGDLNELMLMGAIAGAEMAMLDCGVQIEPGSGVAAAGSYWRSNPAPAGLKA